MLGSSSSDSGGGGVALVCGAATGAREAGGGESVELETCVAAEEGSTTFFSWVGGRSVRECLPVVQGGMERNSSKVKTRGLQHFQPGEMVSQVRDRIEHNAYLSVPHES